MELKNTRRGFTQTENAMSENKKRNIPEFISGSSTHVVADVRENGKRGRSRTKFGNNLYLITTTEYVENPRTLRAAISSGMTPLYNTPHPGSAHLLPQRAKGSRQCGDLVSQGREITVRGFTLIELLVVILIIGILAAVALPQYQLAVARSRSAAVKPFLTAIKEAEEVYYLEHGTYAAQMAKLDLDFTSDEIWSNFAVNEHFRINLLGDAEGANYITASYCPGYTYNNQQCNTHRDFTFIVWFAHSNNPNAFRCNPHTSLGTSICNREKTN